MNDSVKKSKTTQYAVRILPNARISSKKLKIDNQSLRFIPYAAKMAFPLDMSQFGNLFNSTRIPAPGEDIIKAAEIPQKYVLVTHKGRLFKVYAFDSSWNVRKPADILGDIEQILKTHENSEIKNSVCALTSWDRDSWTNARRHLVETGNQKSLKDVDEALFCIALDETKPTAASEAAMAFLAGDARSRWFDKVWLVRNI